MDEKSVAVLYKRYFQMSMRLNREAYRQQMTGRIRPLRQFFPCQKALIFTAAMGNPAGVVTGIVIPQAAQTICVCHPGLSEADLWDLYAQVMKMTPQE